MRRRLVLVIGLGGFAIAAACTPVKPPAGDTTPPPMPSIDLDLESDGGPPHDDNNTNDTTPTFVGTAEAGAKVRVLDGVTDVAVGTANGSGTYMATTSVLAPGSHDIRAIAVDPANNQSEPSTLLVVTIDTTAPGAPSTPDLLATDDSGLSSTDNVTNKNQPTFTGTKLANHSVQLFSGSTLLGTEAPDGTTSYSITSGPVMGDGLHSVAAVQVDPAGNISVVSGALSVRIDTVAPAVGLDAESDPSGASPSLSGAVGTALGDLATVTVEIFEGTNATGTPAQTPSANVGVSTWSAVPSPALTVGEVYTVQAKQGDVAGNLGVSTPDTFTA